MDPGVAGFVYLVLWAITSLLNSFGYLSRRTHYRVSACGAFVAGMAFALTGHYKTAWAYLISIAFWLVLAHLSDDDDDPRKKRKRLWSKAKSWIPRPTITAPKPLSIKD